MTKTQILLAYLVEPKTIAQACAFIGSQRIDNLLQNLKNAGCITSGQQPSEDSGKYKRSTETVYVATGVPYAPRSKKGVYTSTNPETISNRERVQKWEAQNKEHRKAYMREYYAKKLSKKAREAAES